MGFKGSVLVEHRSGAFHVYDESVTLKKKDGLKPGEGAKKANAKDQERFRNTAETRKHFVFGCPWQPVSTSKKRLVAKPSTRKELVGLTQTLNGDVGLQASDPAR